MKQRVMARPSQPPRKPRWRATGVVAIVVVLAIIGLIAVSGILAGGPGASPTGSPGIAGLQSAGSSIPVVPSRAPQPATTEQSEELQPAKAPSPSASLTEPTNSPAPLPTRALEGGAPTSPAEFDLEGQQISMGFPLRADSQYRYRDNFHDIREGSPEAYNHARIHADGSATRLHDGTDIYTREAEPLIAPFSGTVIDPKTRWQPWEPARYGKTVVIVSDEPLSTGYLALLVHMDEVWVEPGTRVTRGQVVGTVGRTGNADSQSVRPHLHFELRAPFLLDWSAGGDDRPLDAFNPYPSLVEADPKRN